MKKQKEKNNYYVFGVILIFISILLITVVTFAYFTDSQKQNSSINFGKIELEVDEPFSSSIELKDVIPGDKILDKVAFSKTVDSESMYVRAKLTYEATTNSEQIQNILKELNNSAFNLKSSTNYKWSNAFNNIYYLVKTEDQSKLYELNNLDQIVLTDAIYLSTELTQGSNYELYFKNILLKIEIQAIQSVNISDKLLDTNETFGSAYDDPGVVPTDPKYLQFEGDTFIGLTDEAANLDYLYIPNTYSTVTNPEIKYQNTFNTESEVEKFYNGVTSDGFSIQKNTQEAKDAVTTWYNEWINGGKELPITFTYIKDVVSSVYGDEFKVTTIDLNQAPNLWQSNIKTLIIPETITSFVSQDTSLSTSVDNLISVNEVVEILNGDELKIEEGDSGVTVTPGIGGDINIGGGGVVVVPPVPIIIDPIPNVGSILVTSRNAVSTSNITSIIVDEANTLFDSRNGCNAIIETKTNTLITACLGTVLPNSIETLGTYSMTPRNLVNGLPEGIKTIKSFAVITDILVYPDQVDLIIPSSVTTIESNAFATGKINITFAENSLLETIGDYAFADGCIFDSLTLPSSVTSIGQYAMPNTLKEITINQDSNLSTLNEYAFANTQITSIYIPAKVSSISESTFEGCPLTSIVVDNGNATYKSSSDSKQLIRKSDNMVIYSCA